MTSTADKIEAWMQVREDYVGDCIALQNQGDEEDVIDGYDMYDDLAEEIEYLNPFTLKITLLRDDTLSEWLLVTGTEVAYCLKDGKDRACWLPVKKGTYIWQYATDMWQRTTPE